MVQNLYWVTRCSQLLLNASGKSDGSGRLSCVIRSDKKFCSRLFSRTYLNGLFTWITCIYFHNVHNYTTDTELQNMDGVKDRRRVLRLTVNNTDKGQHSSWARELGILTVSEEGMPLWPIQWMHFFWQCGFRHMKTVQLHPLLHASQLLIASPVALHLFTMPCMRLTAFSYANYFPVNDQFAIKFHYDCEATGNIFCREKRPVDTNCCLTPSV